MTTFIVVERVDRLVVAKKLKLHTRAVALFGTTIRIIVLCLGSSSAYILDVMTSSSRVKVIALPQLLFFFFFSVCPVYGLLSKW